jgi:hypothetical protein
MVMQKTTLRHITPKREFKILRELGLEESEIEFLAYLKYKEEIRNKWN